MEKAPQAFIDRVEHDPLFAAEGMDVDNAAAAIEEIQKVLAKIEEVYSKISFATRLFLVRYPLASHALPLPFIKSFIQSERARREFISSPHIYAGRKLIDAWQDTQQKLSQSIERYTMLHKKIFLLETPENRTALMQDMYGNLTSAEDVNAALVALQSNAAQLGQEVRECRLLLNGQEEPRTADKKSAASHRPLPVGAPASLTPEHERLHALEREHILPFRKGKVVEEYGPFSYTVAGFEATPREHLFKVYFVRDNTTDLVSIKVCALDTYLFLKIAGEGVKNMQVGSLHEALVERGFRYWFQPSTNLYSCRDQRYWAVLATAADLVRRPELSATALQAQLSSTFDLLLATCMHDHLMHLSNVREMVFKTGIQPNLWNGLLFRTHPSIYYLPFNSSVWRLAEKPNFLGSSIAAPEDVIFCRAEAMLADTTQEEVEMIMQGSRIREQARAGI